MYSHSPSILRHFRELRALDPNVNNYTVIIPECERCAVDDYSEMEKWAAMERAALDMLLEFKGVEHPRCKKKKRNRLCCCSVGEGTIAFLYNGTAGMK